MVSMNFASLDVNENSHLRPSRPMWMGRPRLVFSDFWLSQGRLLQPEFFRGETRQSEKLCIVCDQCRPKT
jgi:hypothetical protein